MRLALLSIQLTAAVQVQLGVHGPKKTFREAYCEEKAKGTGALKKFMIDLDSVQNDGSTDRPPNQPRLSAEAMADKYDIDPASLDKKLHTDMYHGLSYQIYPYVFGIALSIAFLALASYVVVNLAQLTNCTYVCIGLGAVSLAGAVCAWGQVFGEWFYSTNICSPKYHG